MNEERKDRKKSRKELKHRNKESFLIKQLYIMTGKVKLHSYPRRSRVIKHILIIVKT